MGCTKNTKPFIFIVIVFFPIYLFASTKILFISSYNASFPTIPKQLEGIYSSLDQSLYQIDVEYMDTKRVDPKKVEPVFLSHLLLKKELLNKYDIVLVGDDNALHFVEKYQNKLFKKKPIVFLAINNERYAKNLSINKYITGVIEKQSISETLNLIKKIHPEFSKTILISDNSTTSDGILNSFTKEELQQVEVFSLKRMNYEELSAKLKLLSYRQPVLYLSAMSDKEGTRKEFYDSIEFIKKSKDIPLYHLYEHGIGEGMIGGKVVMFSKQGSLAADIIKQIAHGKHVEDIDYISQSPNMYLFDYNEIEKFNIDSNLLPDNSIIMNLPPTFMEENFKKIGFVLLLVILLALSIIIIQYLRAKKRSYELSKLNRLLKFEKTKFQSLLTNASDGIHILDLNGNLIMCSDSFAKKLGYTTDEILKLNLLDWDIQLDKAQMKKTIQELIKKPKTFQTLHQKKDKTTLDVQISAKGIKIGGNVYLYASQRDISLQKKYEKKLKERKKTLKDKNKLLQSAHDNFEKLLNLQNNIVILDDGIRIQFANKKFFDFLGYKDIEEFTKYHKSISECFIDNDRFFHTGKTDNSKNWIDLIQKLPSSERMVSILGKDFKPYAFSVSISSFEFNTYIVTFSDISETMLEYIRLEEKTIHDKLTGAYNREFFEQNYKRLLVDYNTGNSSLAIGILDIDHFKSVNDTYGHDVGDEILIEFVKTIKKYSRADDIIIRWGGEEFVLIVKVNSKYDLVKVLEHLRKVIELESFSIVGQKTCSIGGSIYQGNEAIETTLKRADEALYDAKASGRNRVMIK